MPPLSNAISTSFGVRKQSCGEWKTGKFYAKMFTEHVTELGVTYVEFLQTADCEIS